MEAEKYLNEALKIRKKLYGPNHVRTSTVYYLLSLMYEKMQNKKAIYYAKLSQEIRKEKLGKENI